MNIILVSSEGDEVIFDEKILQFSDFLNRTLHLELPDPFAKVYLSGLSINTESLQFIQIYFNTCNYQPSPAQETNERPLYKAYQKLPDYEKIDEIEVENLLLFTLACHKLNIKSLQSLLLARIASLVDFDSYEAGSEQFGLEMSEDEHLNNYLKYENRWASLIEG